MSSVKDDADTIQPLQSVVVPQTQEMPTPGPLPPSGEKHKEFPILPTSAVALAGHEHNIHNTTTSETHPDTQSTLPAEPVTYPSQTIVITPHKEHENQHIANSETGVVQPSAISIPEPSLTPPTFIHNQPNVTPVASAPAVVAPTEAQSSSSDSTSGSEDNKNANEESSSDYSTSDDEKAEKQIQQVQNSVAESQCKVEPRKDDSVVVEKINKVDVNNASSSEKETAATTPVQPEPVHTPNPVVTQVVADDGNVKGKGKIVNNTHTKKGCCIVM